MAGEEREADPDLTRLDALRQRPEQFHIFKALRLIEAVYSNRPRLGRSRRPAEDPVRLRQEPELAFPPSTVSSFSLPGATGPGQLTNRFFGLWGPHGPLPLHITEYARDRQRNWRDPTMVAFADMFHHRMMALLYRAWASAEPTACYDRRDDDPFSERVAAVAGLKGPAFRNRDAMPDVVKRSFSGRLAHGPKNEEGLLALVSHFFLAPVSIESFVGCWLQLDPSERFSFQDRRVRPRMRLGQSITIGERVWTREAKFRIRIGPLSLAAYRRLLPGGESLRRLRAIVLNYSGETLDWELNLVLRADEVPETRLGEQGQLGWTTWIGRRPEGRDADDLRLAPQPVPGVPG